MKYFIMLFTILTVGISQDGKFSGLVFYNYTYDLTEDAANDEGFALNRVYLTYTQELSKGISYKFQTDINSSVEPKEVYLKNAKIDWESRIGKLTIGLQGMNVFNIAEKNWGFRFLEQSPMNKYGFSSSADMGIGYSGTLSIIDYNLMVTNGTGYKKNEDDKHKKISTQFVYGEKNLIKNDGFNVGLTYTMENYDTDTDVEIDSVTWISVAKIKNKTLVGLFGGYSRKGLRIGGEFDMYTHPFYDINSTYEYNLHINTEITSQIMAFYTSYKITSKLEGLVRYDMYDPYTDSEPDGRTYLIAGLNYYPAKGLIITPNVRLTTPEEGEETTHAMLNFRFKF